MTGKTSHLIAFTLLFFTILRTKVVMCGLHEYCDNCKTRAYNIICCYVEDQCCGIDNDHVGSYETSSQSLPTITPFISTTDSTTTGFIIGNQTVTSIATEQKETNTNQFPLTTLKIPTTNNGSSTTEDTRQTSSPIISSESMMTSNNSFTLNPNSTTSIRADVSISSTTATNLNVDSGNTSPIENLTTNSVPRRTTKNVVFWSPSNNTEIPASNTTSNISNIALVETTSNSSAGTSTLSPATLDLANVTSTPTVVNASTSTTKEVGVVTPSYVLNVSTTQAKSGTSFNSLGTESINLPTATKGYEPWSSVSSTGTTVKIGNDSSLLEDGVLPWRRTTKGSSEEISTIRKDNLNEAVSTSTNLPSEVTKLENATTNHVSTINITNGTTVFPSSATPITVSPHFENATTTASPSNTTHQSINLSTTTNSSTTANSSSTASPSNTTHQLPIINLSTTTNSSTTASPLNTTHQSTTTNLSRITTTNFSTSANSSTTASPTANTNLSMSTNSSTAATSSPSTTTSASSLSPTTTIVTRNGSNVSVNESVWQDMDDAFNIGTNQDGRNKTSLLSNSTIAQSTTTSTSPSSVSIFTSPVAITTGINFLNLFSTTTKSQNKSQATGATGAVNYTLTPKIKNGTKTKPTIPTVTNFSSRTSTSMPAVTAGKTTQSLGKETSTLSSISNVSTRKDALKTTPRPTQRITTRSFTQKITATPSVLTVVTQFTEKSTNFTTPTSQFKSASTKMSGNNFSSESGDDSGDNDASVNSSSRKTTPSPLTSDEYEAETSYEDATS